MLTGRRGDARKGGALNHIRPTQPVWHSLRSSRSRSTVTGELLVQVGFIPVDTKSGTTLSQEQRQRIVTALTRAAEELEHSRRASMEERILLAAPVRPPYFVCSLRW